MHRPRNCTWACEVFEGAITIHLVVSSCLWTFCRNLRTHTTSGIREPLAMATNAADDDDDDDDDGADDCDGDDEDDGDDTTIYVHVHVIPRERIAGYPPSQDIDRESCTDELENHFQQ